MALKKQKKDKTGGGDEDLLVTPILDLLVSLIPLLILGVVVSKVHVIDVGIARPVKRVQANANANFNLELKIDAKTAVLRLSNKNILSVNKTNDTWIDEVYEKLVEIKKDNLSEFRIRINPSNDVNLEELTLIMDSVRELRVHHSDIVRTESDGTQVKVQYLFPNIVLQGVYES